MLPYRNPLDYYKTQYRNPLGSGFNSNWFGSTPQQAIDRTVQSNLLKLQAAGAVPPPRKPKTNPLFTALDYIDRPRNAVVTALSNVLSGEDSAWAGLTEGITGQTKTSMSDILEDYGVQNKFLQFALGLAGDVLLDPTTYIGYGLLTKPTASAVKGVGKGVVAKGLEKQGVAGATEALKQTLQTGSKAVKGNIAPLRALRQGVDDVAVNLANIVSRPAFSAGQAIGKIPGVGAGAVDVADWLGKTFKGIHYTPLMPAGIQSAMTKYADDVAKLERISGTKAFSKMVKKLPQHIDDMSLQEIAKLGLKKADMNRATLYKGLKDAVSMNPYTQYIDKTFKPAQQAILQSQQAANAAAGNINRYFKEYAPITRLEKVDREFLATAIEAPVEYIKVGNKDLVKRYGKDVVREAKQIVNHQGRYQELLTKLADTSLPLKDRTFNAKVKRLLDEADGKIGEAILEYAKTPEHVEQLTTATKAYMGRIKELGDMLPDTDKLRYYVPHIYENPDALKAVDVQYLGKHDTATRQLRTTVPFEKQRHITTLKQAEKFGLKPNKDLLELQLTYEKRMAQRQIRKDLIGSMIDSGVIVGKDTLSQSGGGTWVRDMSHFNIPELKGMAVHKEVYDLLKQVDHLLTDNKELQKLGRFMSKANSMWKLSTTAARPAWAVQNIVGNNVNMYLAGMNDPTRIMAANNVMTGNLDKVTAYLKKHGVQMTGDEFNKKFIEFIGEGFGQTLDVYKKGVKAQARQLHLQAAHQGAQQIGEFVKNPLMGWIDTISRLSERSETQSKMALFMDRLIKGDSAEQAAKVVKAALFDYTDLTKVERGIRHLVPFYTFTRKNLPYQLAKLVENPERFLALRRLQEGTFKAFGTDTEDMPEYLQERAFAISPNKVLNLGMPWDTINQVTQPNEMLSMLTPFLRVPMEMAMNKSMFSQQPIEKYEGQRSNFMGIDMNAKLAYALNQLGAARELSGAVKEATTQQDVRDTLAAQSGQAVTGGRVTAPLGSSSDNPLVRALGALAYPVARQYNPAQAHLYGTYDYNRQLEDLIKALQAQGIYVPSMNELRGMRGQL